MSNSRGRQPSSTSSQGSTNTEEVPAQNLHDGNITIVRSSKESQQPYRRSVSEAVEEAPLEPSYITAPNSLASIIERPFQVKSAQTGKILPEATGWSMDSAARGPLNLAGAHIGNALIVLAMADAGCTSRRCDNKVYGIRATNILPVTSMVVSIIAGILMPIFGSVIDHTSHRKLVGSITALFVVATVAAQVAISQENWFIMLCFEGVGAFMLQIHITAAYAYLPDLSMYENDFIRYTSGFNIRQIVSQLLHGILVVVLGGLRPDPASRVEGSIKNARTSASIALGISCLLFGYSWIFLFRKRPPLSPVPEGQSLVFAGFARIHKTSQLVWKKYHALKWLMIALLWSPEVGTGLILSITTTFLSVWLDMDAMEISLTSLIMLVASIPGSIGSRVVCRALDPLRSYQLALLTFMTVTALSAGFLNSPSRKALAYGASVLWGICVGWLYPTQRVLFCTLIPRGQEMEFMGIFTFFGNILSWLPPLLFTILNECIVSMQWGLSVIPFFLFASFACTLMMGKFEDAVNQVATVKGEDSSSSSKHDGGSSLYEGGIVTMQRRDTSDETTTELDGGAPSSSASRSFTTNNIYTTMEEGTADEDHNIEIMNEPNNMMNDESNKTEEHNA